MEVIIDILQKLGLGPPYDPGIPHLLIYSKDLKLAYSRNAVTSISTAASFTVAKVWNKHKYPSIDKW